MSNEEYRNLYLGKTPTCINLYLGAESAKFAEFLYKKVGIEFEVYKTDMLLQKDDFFYLIGAGATTFRNVGEFEEVKHMTTILMDAYDIMNKQGFGKALTVSLDANTVHAYNKVYGGVNHIMFHNKNENVAVFVEKDHLPEFKDSILTVSEWSIVARYQVDMIASDTRDLLHTMFHGRSFKYKDLYKKLCAFDDLFVYISPA